MSGVGDVQGQVAGGCGDGGVGEVGGVDEALVVDVDEEMVVGEEVSGDDRQGDVGDDEIPSVGPAGEVKLHVLGAEGVNGGTISGDEVNVGAGEVCGRHGFGQEGTAGTGVDEVFDVRAAIRQEENGRAAGHEGDWRRRC